MNEQSTLGVAILGCGRHGERYLRHIQRDTPGAHVEGIWRRDRVEAERIGREYGVTAVSSAEALVADPRVKAVIVTTPPALHGKDVELALAAGKPVLVEKPLAGTLSQARALVQSAAGYDVPVMVAQTLRYNPVLQVVRERWREVGTVHRMRQQQRLEPSTLAWQQNADVSGGGSIVLTGVHLFDTMRWILGRTPDAVRCTMLAVEGNALENVFDACFEYQAEALLAATEVSKFTASRSGQLEIVGTKGQWLADYGRGELWLLRGTRAKRVPGLRDAPTLPAVLADFIRVVRREVEPPITLADGLATMVMADGCYQSRVDGRRVLLTDESNP